MIIDAIIEKHCGPVQDFPQEMRSELVQILEWAIARGRKEQEPTGRPKPDPEPAPEHNRHFPLPWYYRPAKFYRCTRDIPDRKTK